MIDVFAVFEKKNDKSIVLYATTFALISKFLLGAIVSLSGSYLPKNVDVEQALIIQIMLAGYLFPLAETGVMALILEGLAKLRVSRWWAILLMSLMFGFLHYSVTISQIAIAALGFIIYGFVYVTRRQLSIFEAIKLSFICHMTWNLFAIAFSRFSSSWLT